MRTTSRTRSCERAHRCRRCLDVSSSRLETGARVSLVPVLGFRGARGARGRSSDHAPRRARGPGRRGSTCRGWARGSSGRGGRARRHNLRLCRGRRGRLACDAPPLSSTCAANQAPRRAVRIMAIMRHRREARLARPARSRAWGRPARGLRGARRGWNAGRRAARPCRPRDGPGRGRVGTCRIGWPRGRPARRGASRLAFLLRCWW